MSVTYISITPHDPIIARDKPRFGAGLSRMKSLDWPVPLGSCRVREDGAGEDKLQ